MDGFTGELLHSSDYRNPGPYRGKKALVVGCGSSGMEIAHDLATGGAAKAWLAVRTPPNIMLRSLPGGLPVDVIALPLYHIPIRIADAIGRASRRAESRRSQRVRSADSRGGRVSPAWRVPTRCRRWSTWRSSTRSGRIHRGGRHRRVVSTATTVALVDGSRLDPDVVICATGYQPRPEPLVGHLGVLDANGKPVVQGDKPAAAGPALHRIHGPAVAHRVRRQAVQAHRQAHRSRVASAA